MNTRSQPGISTQNPRSAPGISNLPAIPPAPRYKARSIALEARLREAVAQLDSYADDMPFTAIGLAAHKERVAKLLDGLEVLAP